MEFTFQSTRTYRCEISGSSGKDKTLMYVLHGYGQLAKFFIRKFEFLSDDYLIVAPEGMHRYYLEGTSGRVGASWMTKEARELDISDNVSWLDSLHEKIEAKYEFDKIVLLGFSQGGATAARWEQLGKTTFNAMVMWACVFPPDLHRDHLGTEIESHFAIGDNDEWYDEKARKELITFYRNLGYKTHEFSGNHDIDQECLKDILLTLS